MKTPRVALMIVVTALLATGSAICANLAWTQEGFSEQGITALAAIFCVMGTAISAIFTIGSTYAEVRRGRLDEEEIRALQDWSPVPIVVLAAVIPLLLYSCLLYMMFYSLPPLVYVPLAFFAAIGVWTFLRWLFESKKDQA
jgi:hypothetical protein